MRNLFSRPHYSRMNTFLTHLLCFFLCSLLMITSFGLKSVFAEGQSNMRAIVQRVTQASVTGRCHANPLATRKRIHSYCQFSLLFSWRRIGELDRERHMCAAWNFKRRRRERHRVYVSHLLTYDQGRTERGKGTQCPGGRKIPAMPQVLSSVQYIFSRKTLGSNMGAPDNIGTPLRTTSCK